MVFRRYWVQMISRLLVVMLAMFALVWFAVRPGYHSMTLIAFSIFSLSVFLIWNHINRTNKELSRFLDAARYADFSQRFSFNDVGTGFDELGQTFTDILARQRLMRTSQQQEVRHLRALIEHIPVPLMTVHGDGSVILQNNAARRLFGSAHVVRLEDFRQFGEGFYRAMSEAVPGNRELVAFTVEGDEYKLTLATSEIVVSGDSQRVISLQDIQSELDETQAEAWQDLVRVLTHEIMNSITPVTSLAMTARDVVEDIVENTDPEAATAADLADLRDAVSTLARRSDSLMQFVESYRQVTRMAPPHKKRIRLDEMFKEVDRLVSAEWPSDSVSLKWSVNPAGLDVYADRDLLEPVLLNLLHNAWYAMEGMDSPKIQLTGRLNRRGNVVIEVRDNGPGVASEIASKIFVPFFTTRRGGSGVGLALARQVMIAHGGFIRVAANQSGGAKFTLTF
jgi:nitrogen fixation/metabolism regulation signal transduction histidine kinase